MYTYVVYAGKIVFLDSKKMWIRLFLKIKGYLKTAIYKGYLGWLRCIEMFPFLTYPAIYLHIDVL